MPNAVLDTDALREEYVSLSEYLDQVKGLIEDAEGLPGWIVCELAKVSWSRGHCYLEMVESGAGGQTLAKARGTIWSYKASVLNNIFRLGTGDDLREGIKVMLYVQVQFSTVYGLSLNVLDLNPSYTLGDMEAQKRATLARLEREGLIDRNKELEVPLLPYRIAVVSASGAAGYGDFMKHLSDSGISFEVELFEAAVQGVEAPSSIAGAFDVINGRAADFDVAVLIRGGGSNLDLACFDDYVAAKAVALCNLPVICGIGHERDNHICDDVASVRVKTPTGAADYLVGRYADAAERISEAEQRVTEAYAELLDENSESLNNLSLRLFGALSCFTESRSGSLKDYILRLSRSVSLRTAEENHRLQLLSAGLREKVGLLTVRGENFLDKLQAMFEAADPTRILDKGYGIILKDGQKVSAIKQITEGDRITVWMKDGRVSLTATAVQTEEK